MNQALRTQLQDTGSNSDSPQSTGESDTGSVIYTTWWPGGSDSACKVQKEEGVILSGASSGTQRRYLSWVLKNEYKLARCIRAQKNILLEETGPLKSWRVN